jgi:hypothetical protein
MIYKTIIPFTIAFILGTEGIFTGYTFSGFPIIRLSEIILFILIIKSFFNDIKENLLLYFFMKFILVLIILLFLKLGVLIFYKHDMATFIFLDIFRVILYGIIIYLGYFMLTRNFKYINILLFFSLLIYLVAFFQSELTPFTDFSQNLKLQYFSQNTEIDISEKSLFSRLTGLYSYTLVLGYALLTTSIVLVYMYIKTSSKKYMYYFLFLGLIIFLTLTRSIIISWAILLIFIIFNTFDSNNQIKKIAFLIIILFSTIYGTIFYNNNIDKLSRGLSFTDKTTEGRIPLLITGAYALILNPLGITDNDYTEVKKEMFKVFKHPDILVYPSHNALINLGIQYTILGLIAFLYFLYKILKIYIKHINQKYHRYIQISLLAYITNGLVHNAFLFNLDFPILIFLSILAYEYKLKKDNKE